MLKKDLVWEEVKGQRREGLKVKYGRHTLLSHLFFFFFSFSLTKGGSYRERERQEGINVKRYNYMYIYIYISILTYAVLWTATGRCWT